MKSQWIIVLGIGLAFIAAIVAVFNVEPVSVNYIFGEVDISLIIIIIASILLGGILVAIFGFTKPYRLKKEKKILENENTELHKEKAKLQTKIHELENQKPDTVEKNVTDEVASDVPDDDGSTWKG